MNIPTQFDIEQKLLADSTSKCNKILLKSYYLLLCFLKSFVLIALALATIYLLFQQSGVKVQFQEVFQKILKNNTSSVTNTTSID